MTTSDMALKGIQGAEHAEEDNYLTHSRGIRSWLFTLDHKRIGVMYLASTLTAFLIGGIFALALTGEYLSVPASVGFIALLGIAVLNGVVMVSWFNQLRDLGRPMAEVLAKLSALELQGSVARCPGGYIRV